MSEASREPRVLEPSRECTAAMDLVERYFDMWNAGTGAVADEVLAPTYVDHEHPSVVGPAATRSLVPRFQKDGGGHVEAEIVAAGEDFVAARRTIRVLREGAPVEMRAVVLFRVAEGKLAEQWSWPENDDGR
ncbi:MAG TPA: nuclear transport factor 2 family protein [Polyangiaceae bacterium]|jgi:ketosteroid isomerase-like protein